MGIGVNAYLFVKLNPRYHPVSGIFPAISLLLPIRRKYRRTPPIPMKSAKHSDKTSLRNLV